jgi:hypothetical protein
MRNISYWIIALVITLSGAIYQRISGPTYPESGRNQGIEYKFHRSHSGFTDQSVEVPVKEGAYLHWKRFKTNDEWTLEEMEYTGEYSSALLPAQPPAGKLEYFVIVENAEGTKRLPPDHNVVTRFKGEVPAGILIPHIILIFLAMLISTRTGMEALRKDADIKGLTIASIVTLTLGGMIFGPLTQLYAFDALWTGFPFGYDLTDNKTLIAFIGWLIAGYAVLKNRRPRFWVIFAALLMLVIFLIPHSLLGSELDYSKFD